VVILVAETEEIWGQLTTGVSWWCFLPGLEEPCSQLLVCCQWCMLVCGGCSEL